MKLSTTTVQFSIIRTHEDFNFVLILVPIIYDHDHNLRSKFTIRSLFPIYSGYFILNGNLRNEMKVTLGHGKNQHIGYSAA